MKLQWRIESMRIVAVCGDLDVGAIFPGAGVRCRWRVWITPNANPVDGTSKDDAIAKQEVEKRFDAFLTKAKLQPIPEPAT